MKTIIANLAAAVSALFLAGCATTTQQNAGAFLSKVAAMDVTATDVHQSTNTPLYSHSESLSGLSRQANGTFAITNLKATFSIPLWGVTWDFSASGISGNTPSAVAAIAQVSTTK